MLDNIKIRVKNPEHSRAVQKKLFEMGYEWWYEGHAHTSHVEETFLYAKVYGEHKILTFSSSENHFKNQSHEFKEVFLVNGEFSDFPEDNQPLVHHREVIVKNPQKPPIGLRPKYIANLERMQEILEAAARYVEAEKRIPSEWLTEFDSLNQGIPEKPNTELLELLMRGARV